MYSCIYCMEQVYNDHSPQDDYMRHEGHCKAYRKLLDKVCGKNNNGGD